MGKINLIKKSGLRKFFKQEGFRISNKNLEIISLLMSDHIRILAEKIMRNARTSGLKTINLKNAE